MVLKEKTIKGIKAIAIVLAIVLVVFIVDTTIIAFSVPDYDFEAMLEQTYVSKSMKSTLKFVSDKQIMLVHDNKPQYFEIVKLEQNIMLTKSETEEEYIIKIFSNEKIYCEKTKEYMFLATNEVKK